MLRMSGYPYSSMNDSSPALMSAKTSGPLVSTPVPTWKAEAPAMMYSRASLWSSMPPTPTMGMLTALCRSQTARTPTGLMHLPDSPQVLLLISGLANSGTITIAFSVFIATMASAPADSAADAICVRMWVLGVSFTHTGTDTASLTADTMPATTFGSVPNSMPYPCAWGQDRFSSTAQAP